jgi:hypothetical protein
MRQPHDKVGSAFSGRAYDDRASVCGSYLAHNEQPQSCGIWSGAGAPSERVKNGREQIFRYQRASVVNLNDNETFIAADCNFDVFAVAVPNRID